ncbi:MAG TPA: cation:proton antiporter, partial [Candidatus Acidoferrum sp.]|nr:cation:proton antiporter [Candidatus Acidoferrum sp.]
MDASAVNHDALLNDIALCVVVAWGLGVLAKLLRQPLILAYLAAGVLVGPVGLKWISDRDAIATISELGLIFLLFMIGLEINLKSIASAGRAILVTSIIQVVGGTLLGLLFFRLIGYSLGAGKLDALYLAIAAALSSTVIIVKILYDKRELETLAGRITLGVLVIQDLFAILFLAVQPNLDNPAVSQILLSLGKVATLVVAALVASKYVLPTLFKAVARLPELVLVGALAWCFLICGLAVALGLSREMGALVAGVAISTFPYALDVTAKVTTLRDFFLTLFFVALGMTIPMPSFALLGMAIALGVFLIATRFITVFIPLDRMNLGHRVSFLPALNLSQVSEFSLVIIALGQ